ncbi:N-acetyltransferase [Arthrobacter sp. NamB2]|uniref:GNAT family N-acetyltransferase n=1 Tax=Arthrobacter sp. NamB2 TaxID=2576035 RepID=UPI0010C9D075|nr:N-acetyltransferase [Arthrobacter sp. NamB2]TKV26131.1 N-acetyltransferase [Arthrobacter sp. NamB2]
MYRLLDTEHPPVYAKERYSSFAEELDKRSAAIAEQDAPSAGRPVFADSRFSSRFELFLDGWLAAFVKYSMSGDRLRLIELIEKIGFEGRGFDRVLLRRIMVDAHKRRLSIVPDCPAAAAFLFENPQYTAFAPRWR